MVALLFPGQGSQFVGMGKDLADRYPAARAVFQEADDVLGVPLSRFMWEGPEDELTATRNAQPAILTHSMAVHRVISERLDAPVFAAGHSLGEFSAYVAAGTMTFADAVHVVRRRGELMFESGKTRPGTMAAVLGLDDTAIDAVCAKASADGEECVAANYNSPGQTVISGDTAAVLRAIDLAKQVGARRAIQLNVSGAFHSPLMRVAEAGLRGVLDSIAILPPAFPVISNVTAQPVASAEEARDLLVEQLTSPVRWTASVQRMVEGGATRFIEIGPGSVLTGLLKRISKETPGETVGTAEEVERFLTQ